MTKMQFKRSVMAVAIAGAIGGVVPAVQAVNLATDGLGEVLLFPYYTINNDYDTYLGVTNTSDKAVAFKVRFREAYNSRDCRDFNVVLSPYDVWTATVTRNANGTARVQTDDNSCTAPTLPALADAPGKRGVDFTNLDFTGEKADTGPTGVERCNAGYVEIIEMGVSDGGPIYNAALHNSAGVPANCALVSSQFQNASSGIPAIKDEFTEPNNVLKGSAVLIRTTQGKNGAYDATTLANFFNPLDVDASDPDDLIAEPRDRDPNLDSANPRVARILNDQSLSSDGFLLATEWDFGIDAVSAVLMRANVINTWSSLPSVNAQTDWVVTFPTKNFYVDTLETGVSGALPPFANAFQGDVDGNGKSCDTVEFKYWNREEKSPVTGCDTQGGCFSPPETTPSTSICYEANLITFNGANALGSPTPRSVDTGDLVNGWMDLHLAVTSSNPADGDNADSMTSVGSGGDGKAATQETLFGLPVIGFAYTTLEDGVTDTHIKNYGSIWNHSYRRIISGESGGGK